ncbi:MAG: sulfite exporter TauE/SafE family protein [Myxococcales bacterium]|nr:sulfite exporter TauE/SafE family protein [Myxococcales bacterium]
MSWVVLILGGIVAGMVNTLAGGGSLLTVPLLMEVGLTGTEANATNRLAVTVQSFVASLTFHRHGNKGARKGLRLLPALVIGAALGALIASNLSSEVFKRVFGVIMVPLALMILRKPTLSWSGDEDAEPPTVTLQAAMFGVGIYLGFIQAGVGILLLLVLSSLGRMKLTDANVIKVLVVGIASAVALLVFAIQGDVRWATGSVLAVANGLGGYLGGLAAIKQGERWIRPLVVLSCLGLSVRLLFLN